MEDWQEAFALQSSSGGFTEQLKCRRHPATEMGPSGCVSAREGLCLGCWEKLWAATTWGWRGRVLASG